MWDRWEDSAELQKDWKIKNKKGAEKERGYSETLNFPDKQLKDIERQSLKDTTKNCD